MPIEYCECCDKYIDLDEDVEAIERCEDEKKESQEN